MGKKHKGPRWPRSRGQMCAWLRDTDTGREILREAADSILEDACRKCHTVGPVPKVLVVARRLGRMPGVEVYHEKGVSVRLEELIDTRDDATTEILAEELLRLQLPRPWRHLLECRSQSEVFRGLAPDRVADGILTRRWLRELAEAKQSAETR